MNEPEKENYKKKKNLNILKVCALILIVIIGISIYKFAGKNDAPIITNNKTQSEETITVPATSNNVLEEKPNSEPVIENNEIKNEVEPKKVDETLTFLANKDIKFSDLQLPDDISGAPKLAIIIDDLGGWVSGTEELMTIDTPLTVAIMPLGDHVKREAEAAKKQGFSIILHQPMEPLNSGLNLGPGGITVDMSDDEIRQILRNNIELIPGLCGINNHMGSKATSDSRVMQIVLEEAKSKGLFFFDSVTISDSIVTSVADTLDMKTLINVKFLDNENTEEYVTKALFEAVNIAQQRGYAAVIGHVRKNTIATLKKLIPQIEQMGIEFVTLDELYEDEEIDTRLQFVSVKRLNSIPAVSTTKKEESEKLEKNNENIEKEIIEEQSYVVKNGNDLKVVQVQNDSLDKEVPKTNNDPNYEIDDLNNFIKTEEDLILINAQDQIIYDDTVKNDSNTEDKTDDIENRVVEEHDYLSKTNELSQDEKSIIIELNDELNF